MNRSRIQFRKALRLSAICHRTPFWGNYPHGKKGDNCTSWQVSLRASRIAGLHRSRSHAAEITERGYRCGISRWAPCLVSYAAKGLGPTPILVRMILYGKTTDNCKSRQVSLGGKWNCRPNMRRTRMQLRSEWRSNEFVAGCHDLKKRGCYCFPATALLAFTRSSRCSRIIL